jgi:hypothetical protein
MMGACREHIAKLGKINRVITCFTIDNMPADNIRMNTVPKLKLGVCACMRACVRQCVSVRVLTTRLAQELEPLGALGDLGWYNVRALQMVYGETTLPERVWASAKLNQVRRLSPLLRFSCLLLIVDRVARSRRTGRRDHGLHRCPVLS